MAEMTDRKRIFVNVIATYGRSLYGLALGLFSGRWVLMSLGEVDYGLMGVVGGLVSFVAFLNSMMAAASSRFFAFALGEAVASKDKERGLVICRQWFSTAVLIHFTLPIVLIVVGYPFGIWMVKNFLTIPLNRMSECIWVWRFVCVSCFVGMVNVPFRSMYNAKQEIAELTIYSVVATTVNVFFLYYMVTHPAVWLAKYAAWTCLVSVVPQLWICIRALQKYPECRFSFREAVDLTRIKQVLSFALCRLFGGISIISSGQGMAILINKMLGPAANAAMQVANSVSSHTMNLSGALSGAFSPALTSAAGEGNLEKMRKFAFSTCRFGALLVLVFAIPVANEVAELMRLWLKTPPEKSAEICLCILVVVVLEKMTDGHWMSIFALGKIAKYQLSVSLLGPLAVLFAWLMLLCGTGIIGIGVALIVGKALTVLVRLYFGRSLCGMSIRTWLVSVFLPIALIAGASFAAGSLPKLIWPASFLRVCATTVVSEMVMLPLVWFLALSMEEKNFILAKISKFLNVYG